MMEGNEHLSERERAANALKDGAEGGAGREVAPSGSVHALLGAQAKTASPPANSKSRAGSGRSDTSFDV